MAKFDLIGGALWENYSNKVAERMSNPRFRGEITPREAEELGGKLIIADWGAEACGDAVRLYWVVDEKTGRILAARFKSFGCGTAIASSDVMAELCIGKTVDEAVKITNLDVERALRDHQDKPAIPPQKMHCSVMAYDVIKQAAAIYKGVNIAELDDQEIVCQCARVTLRTIKEVIKINDLKSVEEITSYTKAGAFCKSCIKPGGHEERKYYLVDILREVRAEMEREKAKQQPPAEKDFLELNLVQQIRLVDKVLEEKIRPFLKKDGGGIEINDIKSQNGKVVIYLSYQGSCLGCASALVGTKDFVEKILQEEISALISVEIV